MPSNQTPLGALPARFRRQRVLIVGCGDVGLRFARVQRHVRLFALTSSPARVPELRARGITPLCGDLDRPATLARLAGLATRVLHLAPPPTQDRHDARTRALVRVLARRTAVQALVYASTSGVYGDCTGDWVDESRPLRPQTERAQRRVDAERQVRWLARRRGLRANVLRVPGIYAPDRAGGTPRERLLRGMPVLQADEDVFTNHVHADDLARACLLALWRGRAQRVYHVCDDSPMAMGDYYTQAAALYGLPAPPRIARAEAAQHLSPLRMSFMGESRRLRNARIQRELGWRCAYASVLVGLQAGVQTGVR